MQNREDLDPAYVALKRAHLAEHLAFDVESWYPLLEPVTFYTAFLPLSLPQASAIVAFYHARYNNRRQQFQPEHAAAIRELRGQLHQRLSSDQRLAQGGFVRLSSRSPKDGMPFSGTELLSKYRQTLEQMQNPELPNTRMRAMTAASAEYWRVRSADDAMSLLLSSERVLVDLNEALVCAPDGAWRVQLSLREWEPELQDQFEFRCFVRHGALVALSQYNHYCMFPEVVAQRQALHELVCSFWAERVVPLLAGRESYDSYVVDVAAIPREARCVVVELNPYKKSTGACLYDWRRDSQLLMGDESADGASRLDDGSCIEVGAPPLRVRVEPMAQLDMMVDMMLDEANRGAEESYLQVLASLEPDGSGTGTADTSCKPQSQRSCLIQ